jgi:hypothetical protein
MQEHHTVDTDTEGDVEQRATGPQTSTQVQASLMKIPAAPLLERMAAVELRPLSVIKDQATELRPWFFEEIMPSGAFLITGRSKIGKSWLLLQLAISAAKASDFLGFPALGKFTVWYIASEDDTARIKSRAAAFGLTDWPDNVLFTTREDLRQLAAQFAPEYTLVEWMRMYLRGRPDIKIVIADTEATIRAAWGHESKKVRSETSVTRKDYAEVSEMDAMAIDLGIWLGLVNHTSKRRAMQWLDIHETINRTNVALAGASGSIVLSDTPDRDPNDSESKLRVLGIRGRDISKEYLLAIEQEQGNVYFTCHGPYVVHVQSQNEKEILTELEQLDKETPDSWHTAHDLAEGLGMKVWAVQKAISRMMRREINVTWKGRTVETKRRLGIRFLPEG